MSDLSVRVCAGFKTELPDSDPDGRLYFGPGPREGVIMMVVVDLALGLVKTAHLASKVSGGDLEWL